MNLEYHIIAINVGISRKVDNIVKKNNRTSLLAACLTSLLVAGCITGEVEEISATVIKVVPTKRCIGGLNFMTALKTDDGRVDSVCTYVGEPGDKVKGYWVSGHLDESMNGFWLRK